VRRVWLQLAAAAGAIFGGAWLIGLWAVGVVLVIAGLAAVADVLLRNSDRWDARQLGESHAEVLERWRRAP
jgi:uncharacterized membrane protein